MALAHSQGMPLGTQAPDFALPGVDGLTHRLEDYGEAKVLVVVFTCNHCPYAAALEGRLVAFQAQFAAQGVQLVAISANDADAYPSDSFEAMQARARESRFNFPYLYDESQEVARAYDAACTPDLFVFDSARQLCYNGRFDDNWRDPGAVKRRDLEAAVTATLQGRPVDFEPVPSMGCNIKWKAA